MGSTATVEKQLGFRERESLAFHFLNLFSLCIACVLWEAHWHSSSAGSLSPVELAHSRRKSRHRCTGLSTLRWLQDGSQQCVWHPRVSVSLRPSWPCCASLRWRGAFLDLVLMFCHYGSGKVLSMMEKVPPPSEATTESAAPAYNLPPGYEDVTHPKPTSRASLPEGRQMPSRPRVSFTHSAPASAQSLPSPGFSQSAQGTTPKSTPSLPPTDTAFLPRSDHAPQPRELPSSGVRPGVQTSLPIFPPLGTNPQQQPGQPGPPRSGPVFRG